MYYQFEGRGRDRQFFYTRYCHNVEAVKAIITKSEQPFRTPGYTVRRRINKVTDELGIVIYAG